MTWTMFPSDWILISHWMLCNSNSQIQYRFQAKHNIDSGKICLLQLSQNETYSPGASNPGQCSRQLSFSLVSPPRSDHACPDCPSPFHISLANGLGPDRLMNEKTIRALTSRTAFHLFLLNLKPLWKKGSEEGRKGIHRRKEGTWTESRGWIKVGVFLLQKWLFLGRLWIDLAKVWGGLMTLGPVESVPNFC